MYIYMNVCVCECVQRRVCVPRRQLFWGVRQPNQFHAHKYISYTTNHDFATAPTGTAGGRPPSACATPPSRGPVTTHRYMLFMGGCVCLCVSMYIYYILDRDRHILYPNLTPTTSKRVLSTHTHHHNHTHTQARAQPELTFLHDVSFEVPPASLTVAIGATGAGKSGLLLSLIGAWVCGRVHCVCMYVWACGGVVFFGGVPPTTTKTNTPPHQHTTIQAT